jgi:hypothetical protein
MMQKPIICISSNKNGKTQVGWVIAIGQKSQMWVKTNNIPPNGFPYCALDFNKMIMKSPCQEAWKKYCGDGRA